MARDVTRQGTAEEIEACAGLVADYDVERFSAIEIGGAFVCRRGRCLAGGEDREQTKPPAHSAALNGSHRTRPGCAAGFVRARPARRRIGCPLWQDWDGRQAMPPP